MLMRSVLDIQDGDELCMASVPDTDFVIVPANVEPYLFPCACIMRGDVVDGALTDRFRQRFAMNPVNVDTLRSIARWLQEGAP